MIRMVRRYFDVIGKPERHVILSRDNAYHGSTMGAASLGGMKETMHRQGGLPIPGIEHVMEPYWYKLGGARSRDEFGLEAARAVEERILALGPERVAAFIAEPIQGAGGVIVPPDTYWPEVARICREHGVLLVADEVICGFGRTGPWFGSEYYGLDPDLMPIAKGLSSGYMPIGGVMVHDRIAEPLLGRGGEFFHGFTWSGHPVACAVALENIGSSAPRGSWSTAGSTPCPTSRPAFASSPATPSSARSGARGCSPPSSSPRTRRPGSASSPRARSAPRAANAASRTGS